MGGERAKGHLDLLLLGVLGAGPLHGYRVIARLRERSDGTFDLPEGGVYPVGASVFGVAAAILLLQSAGALAFSGGSGTRAMLSQGIVCLLAATAFLPTLARILALRVVSGAGAPETGDA